MTQEEANEIIEENLKTHTLRELIKDIENIIKKCNNNTGKNCISCCQSLRYDCDHIVLYRELIHKEIETCQKN